MRSIVAFVFLAAAGGAAIAQTATPAAPAATVAPLTTAQKKAIVEELATSLIDNFVFPEVGQRYAQALRAKAASGGYGQPGDAAAFAKQLTDDLQAVYKEGHLRVSPTPPSGPRAPNGQPLQPVEEAKWIADGVAYIKFNMFRGDPESVSAVERFMAEHSSARALIIDARTHRGGGLTEMDVMLPYLYAKPTPLVQMDTRAAVDAAGGNPFRAGPTLRKLTSPETVVRYEHAVAPGKDTPLRRAKVFYLTSNRTASAAEHLALTLKRTGRATLIGETTRGAGHYGAFVDLGSGFTAFVPVGRTFDPDTGKGWEGTGVAPDVAVPADKALDEALRRATTTASAAVASERS